MEKASEYKKFEGVCTEAFNTLREYSVDLENLFILMLSAGMPELSRQEDVGYLRDMLLPNQVSMKSQQLVEGLIDLQNSTLRLSVRI